MLRVIASSPNDIQRVLDVIVETAEHLCGAHSAAIGRLREWDGRLVLSAVTGPPAESAIREYGSDYFEHLPGTELSRLSPAGRAFLDRKTVAVADLAEAVETDYPAARDSQLRWGERSLVNVPLLQGGQSIGVLGVVRLEVRPFTGGRSRCWNRSPIRPSSRLRMPGS